MLVKSGSRRWVQEEVIWTRSLDGPFLVAKESNQAKSGIGRSRSLRLDSSPVWSRGSRRGLSRRQICLMQIFGAIDHRTRIHKAWIRNLG